MKAIAVMPGKKNSAQIVDVPMPIINDNEVLVKSLECGVCHTDREINEGLYGNAPKDSDYLILGHESFGIVDVVGKSVIGINNGDYVVRNVRRSCGKCKNCLSGANDMCTTGGFVESGIKELHGCMAEYFKDTTDYLYKIPNAIMDVAVLLEPISVVEKAYRQAREIQKRLQWEPRKAMVLGAGPIGLLQTMLLRENGLEVYVVARSKPGNLKSSLVKKLGAEYVSNNETNLDDLIKYTGKFDYVLDASGNSGLAFKTMNYVADNGVLCLSSVTGGDEECTVHCDKVNLEFVLGNKVMFGTVNANRRDYENGIKSLQRFSEKWPEVLNSLFTRNLNVYDYKEALEYSAGDIKTLISF